MRSAAFRDPTRATAQDMADALDERCAAAVGLSDALPAQIASSDPELRPWAHPDPPAAVKQARRSSGPPPKHVGRILPIARAAPAALQISRIADLGPVEKLAMAVMFERVPVQPRLLR